MRRSFIAMLLCAALAAGCAGTPVGAGRYTCGEMRADIGKFRDSAGLAVEEQSLRAGALSREDALLDVELQLRRACRGEAATFVPDRRALDLSARLGVPPP
jgi:hypothetical protein